MMRLLMPQLDRQRANYGLKETNIARLYADVLLLPPTEAERLKHWKNPMK
jgi:DNA ligase-4